jgi:endoglucanase
MKFVALPLGLIVAIMPAAQLPASAQATMVSEPAVAAEDYVIGSWELYRHKFLAADGRIVDDDNGSVSHSEGQGYGMLIAVAAGDRASFDKMLAWTERELFVREDALAAWRWDPAASPHVADKNNASDGDLLIAWALARAAKRWDSPQYLDRARAILDTLGETAVAESRYGKVLLPGIQGFAEGEQPDGPVVNLSYWVFPALAELTGISDTFPATELARNGKSLLEIIGNSAEGLPSDWTSLAGPEPRAADGFPPQFSYNAVRIPLYLAWDGGNTGRLLSPYGAMWAANNNVPAVVDLAAGMALHSMPDQGYLAIADLVGCSLGETMVAERARAFVPTTYYPSTLHILSLMALAERYPTCVLSDSSSSRPVSSSG